MREIVKNKSSMKKKRGLPDVGSPLIFISFDVVRICLAWTRVLTILARFLLTVRG